MGIAYNLTVAQDHTYLVGRTATLVHNTSAGCDVDADGWPVPDANNCEACADAIQDEIGGDIYRIEDGSGAPTLGKSRHDPDAKWFYHFTVLNQGRAYDGFTGRAGMPFNDYRAQWEYGDYLKFTPKGQ